MSQCGRALQADNRTVQVLKLHMNQIFKRLSNTSTVGQTESKYYCLEHKVDSPYFSGAFSNKYYSSTQPPVNTVNSNLGVAWHITALTFYNKFYKTK